MGRKFQNARVRVPKPCGTIITACQNNVPVTAENGAVDRRAVL
jgi:hypothetical protein